MKTKARGIRLPEELAEEVEREQRRTGKNWSETVAELLDEAVKMRRAPGIAFRSGATGRRAAIAGTGIDVWQVVAAFQTNDGNFDTLCEEFSWLEPVQLRAALSFYELYPEQIDARLEREKELAPEAVYGRYPFMRPPGS